MVLSNGTGIYAGQGNNQTVGPGAASYAAWAKTAGLTAGGKYYWENNILVGINNSFNSFGIVNTAVALGSTNIGSYADSVGLAADTALLGGALIVTGATILAAISDLTMFTSGNIFGIAYDTVGQQMWIHKNGVYYSGNPSTLTSPSVNAITAGSYCIAQDGGNVNSVSGLRGGSGLTYAIPTGFTVPA